MLLSPPRSPRAFENPFCFGGYMNHAPKVRSGPSPAPAPPRSKRGGYAVNARLLIDVPQTRHEVVEFADNLWFNDLCGQVVAGEVILTAGAPGSNKSTQARQLALDLVSQGHRVLM